MERKVKMILGDSGGDGHCITGTVILKVSGEDVSNSALSEARARATEATGVDIAGLFEDYEATEMPLASARAILKAGIPFQKEDNYGPVFDLSEDSMKALVSEGYFSEGDWTYGGYFSVVALLMAYMGFGIKDFSYRVTDDEIDAIVGGYYEDRPFGGFGYGFYGN